MAVVLDDLGYDERALETLARWDVPLAVAVIPGAPHADRAVSLAREKRWDLLVHLPMEPESGPSEADSIGTRDDDAAIRARILAALARVPGAIGLNNHEGSKATADPRVMRAVLAVVKEKGLFFLDSRTTNASVAAREAASLGVPFLARDVFLDDVAAETAAKGGVPEGARRGVERRPRRGGEERPGDRDRPPAQGDARVPRTEAGGDGEREGMSREPSGSRSSFPDVVRNLPDAPRTSPRPRARPARRGASP